MAAPQTRTGKSHRSGGSDPRPAFFMSVAMKAGLEASGHLPKPRQMPPVLPRYTLPRPIRFPNRTPLPKAQPLPGWRISKPINRLLAPLVLTEAALLALPLFEQAWGRKTVGKYMLDLSNAPGRTHCYSYSSALDTPTFQCGYASIGETGPLNWWDVECSGWHYGNQAWGDNPVNPVGFTMQFPTGYHGRYLFAGPLVGGIFGCERYNMAHVIFVGNSPFPAEQAALDTVKVRQAVLPIPYAVPQPAPAMDFLLADNPAYRPKLQPQLKPYEVPANTFAVSGNTISKVPVTVHQLVRPPKSVREEKRKVGSRGIPAVYGGFTEFLDLVESLEKALPKQYRPKKGATLFDRIGNLMRNYDKIDVFDAASNIADNHYQDKAIGLGAQYGKRATARFAEKGYWKSIRGISVSRLPGRF